MKVTQSKVKALRELQEIEVRLKSINVESQDWEDTNKEGVTGFLLFAQLESINEQVNNLIIKFK